MEAYGSVYFGVGSDQANLLRTGMNEITMTLTDWGGWVGYQYLIEFQFEAEAEAELIPISPSESSAPSSGPSSCGTLPKWGQWGACTLTCGCGIKLRGRECSTTETECGCTTSEFETCNPLACPTD
jgi:hypothetical protein